MKKNVIMRNYVALVRPTDLYVYRSIHAPIASNPVKSSNYIFPLPTILMSFVIIYRTNANTNGNEQRYKTNAPRSGREYGKEKRCFHRYKHYLMIIY